MHKMKNQEALKSTWMRPNEIKYVLSDPVPDKIPSPRPKNNSKLKLGDLLKNDPRGALFLVSMVIHEDRKKV